MHTMVKIFPKIFKVSLQEAFLKKQIKKKKNTSPPPICQPDLWESEEKLKCSCSRKPAQQNGHHALVFHLSSKVSPVCIRLGISTRSVDKVNTIMHII